VNHPTTIAVGLSKSVFEVARNAHTTLMTTFPVARPDSE
jgi:hypothetical protein